MEVEISRWSTVFQHQKDRLHQPVHDRNVVQEQLEIGCTAVIEEEAELRVLLQTEELRLLSMSDSRGESNQIYLQSLKDLKEQDAISKRELETVTPSDKKWREITDQLKKELVQLKADSWQHRRDSMGEVEDPYSTSPQADFETTRQAIHEKYSFLG